MRLPSSALLISATEPLSRLRLPSQTYTADPSLRRHPVPGVGYWQVGRLCLVDLTIAVRPPTAHHIRHCSGAVRAEREPGVDQELHAAQAGPPDDGQQRVRRTPTRRGRRHARGRGSRRAPPQSSSPRTTAPARSQPCTSGLVSLADHGEIAGSDVTRSSRDIPPSGLPVQQRLEGAAPRRRPGQRRRPAGRTSRSRLRSEPSRGPRAPPPGWHAAGHRLGLDVSYSGGSPDLDPAAAWRTSAGRGRASAAAARRWWTAASAAQG